MSISHNDVDDLIAMSKTAQGPRLNDIRLALNELMQVEQAAWMSASAETPRG